jgi:hypothetical protein
LKSLLKNIPTKFFAPTAAQNVSVITAVKYIHRRVKLQRNVVATAKRAAAAVKFKISARQ